MTTGSLSLAATKSAPPSFSWTGEGAEGAFVTALLSPTWGPVPEQAGALLGTQLLLPAGWGDDALYSSEINFI